MKITQLGQITLPIGHPGSQAKPCLFSRRVAGKSERQEGLISKTFFLPIYRLTGKLIY